MVSQAKLVTRRTVNPTITGSSPVRHPNFMKKLTFLDLGNAFRWMADNLSGNGFMIPLTKKIDLVIIKRDKTSTEVNTMIADQTREFERLEAKRTENNHLADFWV